MKKIFSLILIIALIAVIFTFAACGDNTKNDIKNEMTTLKEEGSSMMDDMSSALSGIGDDLTAEGNVTDNNNSTGLFEGMTSDMSSTSGTTSAPSQSTSAADANPIG